MEKFDYTLSLQTTGADKSAADVQKLGNAIEQVEAKVRKETAATESATRAKQEYSVTASKVTASSGAMGRGIQNVAFQFQDMAVQAEMGVSATRIFSQQVPQLLGGFGAIGAVAGAVIGIGVPLAAALFRSGKEAEDAAPKIDEINDALDNFAESAERAADAKRADVNEAWIESLDAEEKSYERINQRLAIQIALNAKLRAIKEGGDAAEREARIAEIEADPNKSEEDKITETAAIREEAARAAAAAEKQKLDDQAKLDAAAARDAQAKAARQAADAETAAQARAAFEAQRAVLERDYKAGQAAKKDVPALKKQLFDERTSGQTLSPGGQFDAAAFDARAKRITALEAELNTAKKALARVKESETKLQDADANLEQFRAGETKQKQEAEAAQAEAERAADQAQASGVFAREAAPGIDRQLTQDLRGQAARRNAALRRAAQQRQRETQDLAGGRLEEVAGALEGGLDASARQRGLGLRGAGNRRKNETLQAVGKALADGTDAGELQKLGDMIREKQKENGAAMTAALLEIISGLMEQAQQVATIKAQVKALRNNGK